MIGAGKFFRKQSASFACQLALSSWFLVYGLHVLEKAWHHAPFGHVTFAGPQAHVAAAGWSV
jgi:hypothetical protein